jgi:hypothetical protein
MEWGLGFASALAAATDGAFFRMQGTVLVCVLINNNTETQAPAMIDVGGVSTAWPVAANAGLVNEYTIEVTQSTTTFWINNMPVARIPTPTAQFGPTSQNQLPVFARVVNGAIAPATANKLQLSAVGVSVGGYDTNRLWPTIQAGMGGSSIQVPEGGTPGQTSNNVNATGPVNLAAPAAATAGYATLGGQYSFTATASAETDFILFAYQVPANVTLMIRGLRIEAINTGAAVATTATLLQWTLGVGSSAVTLATTETATAKATRRLSVGMQSFPIAAAIGAQAAALDVNYDAPIAVNALEYVHVLFKVPLGTATASQVIRGIVTFNGYFE